MKLSEQQIINKLISLMEIAMIYRSQVDRKLHSEPVLIIIVDRSWTSLPAELLATIAKIFREETDYLYLTFSLEYIEQQLNEYNLFFVYGLRKENLIYCNPKMPNAPICENTVNEDFFSRVKNQLKKKLGETNRFWENAITSAKKSDFQKAAFMFHNYMELFFRAVELFMKGKEKESHRIREHQSYIEDFVPELGGVFHTEVENEQKVLDLLDEVYVVETLNDKIKVGKEQIDVIKSKAEWLNYTVRKVINRQYHAFELKHLTSSPRVIKEGDPQNDTEIAVPEIEEDRLLEQLIELLKSKVNLHSVYLIGRQDKISSWETYVTPVGKGLKQSASYTLLMVTRDYLSIPFFELADDIYNRLSCRVSIIDYSLDEVCYKIDRGNNFLDRFLTEAKLLFAQDNHLTSLNREPHYYENNWKRIHKVWKARFKRSRYLLSILVDAYQEMDEDPTVKMGIMHYALEQVCLGLLYVFWEFRPSHKKLNYLFHLCSNFTPLPDEIFAGTSHTRNHIYQLLLNADHQMRFKTKAKISKKEAEQAFNLCTDFMVEARRVAEAELQRLKRLHCIEDVV